MLDPRKYPKRPIIAVSAVIKNAEKKVLIVRRAKSPGKGLWSLPGGAVKLGEKLEDALEREIQEECGISIEIKKLIGAFDRIFFDEQNIAKYHYVILDYLCYTKADKIFPASDVDDFSWITIDEVNNFKFTTGVKEFLIEGFEKELF
jgi:8-oxo-dGTP diphosphatase